MSGYSWPDHGRYDPDRLRRAWPATITMLPIGARITGKVIARQPFGVFVAIDGAPAALGLAEIISMPRDVVLPAVGTTVSGEVNWHAEHNLQVNDAGSPVPPLSPGGEVDRVGCGDDDA